jgi:hypothetical protein
MVFAVVGLVLLADHGAAAGGGIPLKALAGNYATTCQGPLALCLDSSTFAPTNCGTGSPVVLAFSVLKIKALTRDAEGTACATFIETDASLPVGKNPPAVSPVHPETITIPSYDPTTGMGDFDGTQYSGGKCDGSSFDSNGATATVTTTEHFVASDGGKRIDTVLTSLVLPPVMGSGNAIGAFSLSCTSLRQ